MGYTTDFSGSFQLDRELEPAHAEYLRCFSESRRMQRGDEITAADPVREAVGLPIGIEGEFFVGETDCNVINWNLPPKTQPSLWCEWIPTEDNRGIEWNGAEKFYGYVKWIEYIIESFLKRWGYVLNGSVDWSGEEQGDTGTIVVWDNVVLIHTKAM